MSAVDNREQWCVDNWEAVAAEVGAGLGISRDRASSQLHYGLELLERLPKLGGVFAAGDVDFRIVIAAVFRTGLITHDKVLAGVDARLARNAAGWNALSRDKISEIVDWFVREADPDAVRVARSADDDWHVEISPARDGLAEFWGRVRGPDAAAFDRRLNQLAASVCRDDPRTKRRRLPGLLPRLRRRSGRHGTSIAARARLRAVIGGKELAAEPHYRPLARLAECIRCRDLTCRFPDCDRPAELADIDHTVPYPAGPTHPSNLKLLCRVQHLLKTFYTGPGRWTDRQLPDATVLWTSPSRRVYTTKPAGALFFPQLALPTQELALVTEAGLPEMPGRELMMPTRRRTRARERAARVTWERGRNAARAPLIPRPSSSGFPRPDSGY